MPAPKTIAEVDKLNILIKNYKHAITVNYAKIPNLEEITDGLGTVLPFNAEVHAAITKAGQEALRNLSKRLEEYGIIVDDQEIKENN